MRKFLLLLLLLPLAGMSQTKNVISTFRIFPKVDKSIEFEKGFIAHAKKYHTGDWKWKVFEIQSGPDFGGYQVNEGPLAWDSFDKRGNLGAEHTADWATNVMPFTADRGSATYVEFNEELSSVQLNDIADKILIMHIYPKPGMIINLEAMIKKMKAAWIEGKESVAVWKAVASGEPQYLTISRLKQGLKELDSDFRDPTSERYDIVHGADAWKNYLKDYSNTVEKRWSELLFFRPDLSSQ